MIRRRLEEINSADLQALIDGAVTEGRIDYKQELPGNNDEEKKEFLADISSISQTLQAAT